MVKVVIATYDAQRNIYKPHYKSPHIDREYVILVDWKQVGLEYSKLKTSKERVKYLRDLVTGRLEELVDG